MIIDISRHQGKIDWDKLAPHVDFAFVKMTSGLCNGVDPQFHGNTQVCIGHNIPLYVFYFTRIQRMKHAKKCDCSSKWRGSMR